MNSFIEAQIANMITVTETFTHACEMAALKDDGRISKDEEKQLKKIKAASEKFIKELNHIK